MKCLWHYEWVKLPRNIVPEGKGVLGDWVRLASRAAFRKGTSLYCGYTNIVIPGMWAGGVVGLKSILETKSRKKALDTMDELQQLGYLHYELDQETKKFTYQITDWVRKCSGAACMKGAVYTTKGYGFLCIPRNITERLVRECDIRDLPEATWRDVVATVMESCKQAVPLSYLYEQIEPHKKAKENQWWREKIRQTLQCNPKQFEHAGRGLWQLKRKAV